jgi:hypothetical protein
MINKIINKRVMYTLVNKIYAVTFVRRLSDNQIGETQSLLEAGLVSEPANTSSHAKVQTISISQQEREFADFLEAIAPGILDTNKSVVLEPIPADTLDALFKRNVKFNVKVSMIKGYLAQPLRTALVEKMPSHDSDVVRHPARIQHGIELLYILRCIVAVFPEYYQMCKDILEGLAKTDPKLISDEQVHEIAKLLTKLRGVSAPASAVASAALKIFYTIDGMAFDEFSMSLTALEWEQITANMNMIRLKFAEKVREQSTEEYHNKFSKLKKLEDKASLEADIDKERIPLVRIQKLTLEDLHRETQLKIQSLLNIKSSNHKLRYDRKALLAKVRSTILLEYRKNNHLDILKHARETKIQF